jgi:SAM-dependent methyltransferase
MSCLSIQTRFARKSKTSTARSQKTLTARFTSIPAGGLPGSSDTTPAWLTQCLTPQSNPSLAWQTPLRRLKTGEKVVDAGSGAGFDCFIAAEQVGRSGHVVGIDMLQEMLAKSRQSAKQMGLENVEFREGLLEEMPVEDGWADAVISNGVINLCADKKRVFQEIWRVLRPGGHLQFADIANGKTVPASAVRSIDLWTA